MNTIPLSQKNLGRVSASIQRPHYDRQLVKSGIVHIGVGGFHRSHQAWYTDTLLGEHGALVWGICGIGIREADRKMAEVLRRQDGLYTLTTQYPDGQLENRIIGSITEFILATDEPEQAIIKMADADTKIVSLTITEGGYNMTTDGAFDFTDPGVTHDLEHPDAPQTVFGFLTAALQRRKDAGLPAFTVLSCDNVEHNGDVAKHALLAFASTLDPALGSWIENNVCFPNAMVDRITPVTRSKDIDYLRDSFDLDDAWPVTCEPFVQWVIEDKFSNGRPPYEKVGAQFVPDVTPYEKMKLRLLNAGHSVLGIPGAIYGHPTINACMEDAVFSHFMRAFLDKEATPVLDTVAGIDLDKYKDTLAERFANPNIKDSVSRICSESAAKLPKFLIPTLRENLQRGGSIKYATLILAAWCYYSDKQVDRNGKPLEIIDVMQKQLHHAAKETPQDTLSFLKLDVIFGDLINNNRFVDAYTDMIHHLYSGVDISRLMQSL